MKPKDLYEDGIFTGKKYGKYYPEYLKVKDKDNVVIVFQDTKLLNQTDFMKPSIIKLKDGYLGTVQHRNKKITFHSEDVVFGTFKNTVIELKDEKLYQEYEEWKLIKDI